jgi:hypothetical protein
MCSHPKMENLNPQGSRVIYRYLVVSPEKLLVEIQNLDVGNLYKIKCPGLTNKHHFGPQQRLHDFIVEYR